MAFLRALDLFCGAGGATRGLQRAGFRVTGVDIKAQPRYVGDRFIQADVLNCGLDMAEFDFIWASPVCKRWTDGAPARMRAGSEYPDQIAATRAIMARHPATCIENVMRAPLRADIVLHGDMFPGLRVIRRRKFELSWPFFQLVPQARVGLLRKGFVCVVGKGTPSGVRGMGLPNATAANRRDAMGIDWMNEIELSQSIPPAYSEFIARAWLAQQTVAA
jgi:DNA (cytosine-5)-methyltransferase 1